MTLFGKYQNYHSKITELVVEIVNKYGYSNNSKGFAHWYLENREHMDEKQIDECIIDGDGDNGIDAINLLGDTIILYQFKFPDQVKNINKCVDEKTVLKLFMGYKKLVSTRNPTKANDNFRKYRDIIKNQSIFQYKFVFIAFNNGFSEHAFDELELELNELKEKTGNKYDVDCIQQKNVCDLYDRIQKREKVNIDLIYKKFDTSYNLSEEVKSYVGFANAKDIIDSCKDNMDMIFDENIRLDIGITPVNTGIYNTATGDDSQNFFFYHNGIVLICDTCKNSTGNQTIKLEGASVVNGCQTINSLKRAFDAGKLKDDVFIQFRIIETSDFDLRSKITEYLNSQTPIKDSYFLANESFIRELQSELMKKKYFLERLINEYDYKRKLGKVDEYDKKHLLVLESTIQKYATYFYNEYAARAKRGKSELFDKNVIANIISGINADKVLEAVSWYEKVSKIITLYRKYKRSNIFSKDLEKYLGVKETDDLSDYAFLNTGDLLILNAMGNLVKCVQYSDNDEYIIDAIKVCKNAVIASGLPAYQATKSNVVFENIQKDIKASIEPNKENSR